MVLLPGQQDGVASISVSSRCTGKVNAPRPDTLPLICGYKKARWESSGLQEQQLELVLSVASQEAHCYPTQYQPSLALVYHSQALSECEGYRKASTWKTITLLKKRRTL
jgi:hypothetical protein